MRLLSTACPTLHLTVIVHIRTSTQLNAVQGNKTHKKLGMLKNGFHCALNARAASRPYGQKFRCPVISSAHTVLKAIVG
jgi:hypothetical protein